MNEKKVINVAKIAKQIEILNKLNHNPKMEYAMVHAEGELLIAYKSKTCDSGNYNLLTEDHMNDWLDYELNQIRQEFKK